MWASAASPDVGNVSVVLPFRDEGSPAIFGNVGSLITIPVGETVASS